MAKYSLVNAENDFFKNRENFSRSRPALYPSESSVSYFVDRLKITKGQCLRAAWYRVMGYKKDKPDSPGLSMMGKIGKACENITVDMHKEMGIHVQNNIKFWTPNLIVSGELDWIFKNPMTQQNCGVEEKSYYGMKAEKQILGYKGTKGSKNVPAKSPIAGKPKTNQYLQAITYHFEYKDVLQEYRMYYIDRGNGVRSEFEIGTEEKDGKNLCWYEQIPGPYWKTFVPGKVYYPFTIEDIHSRYKELANYLKEKIMPPKDYSINYRDEEVPIFWNDGEINKTDYEKWEKNPSKYPVFRWNCSYCAYSEQCEKDNRNDCL